MGIRGWSLLADKPLIFFIHPSSYQIKVVRSQRHLMSKRYSCTCWLCSADLTALFCAIFEIIFLNDETWERDQFKGASKICVSAFVHSKLKAFPVCSQQFIARDMMLHVSYILGKTLNLCVCLCFVLSLSLSHLPIIETHFHINHNVNRYWISSQTFSLTTSHRWDTY